MDNIKIYNTETFQIEKKQNDKGNKIILKGNAMPLGETSRNGVFYRPESVKKSYKSLEGKPFLFAHQQDEVRHILGKIENVNINDTHVTYEADIDPEEKEFIRKSEKGYIKNVSVGVLINPETIEIDEEKGIANVDVEEFVELSSAPVPGYQNTSGVLQKQVISIAEKLGKEDIANRLKEKLNSSASEEKTSDAPSSNDGEKESETEEKESEDKPETETETKTETETESEKETDESDSEENDEMKELKSRIEELSGKMEGIENVISALQSKVDTILDEQENEDEDKDEDEDEDKDKEKLENTQSENEDEDKEDKDKEDKEEIEPDKEESFEGKDIPKMDKSEVKKKEKELNSEDDILPVNMEKTIKSNKRY